MCLFALVYFTEEGNIVAGLVVNRLVIPLPGLGCAVFVFPGIEKCVGPHIELIVVEVVGKATVLESGEGYGGYCIARTVERVTLYGVNGFTVVADIIFQDDLVVDGRAIGCSQHVVGIDAC